MKGFFDGIDPSMEYAAMIDGCSRWGAFLRVAMPSAVPGLTALAILCWLYTWNEFLFALILTGHETPILTVVMAQFVHELGMEWHLMSATARAGAGTGVDRHALRPEIRHPRIEGLNMAEVALHSVRKSYGNVVAVKDFSLEIKDHEFVVLVGPSGCGKSTTLRMIAGLEDVSRRHHRHRRPGRQRPAAEGSRYRDGVPELRALPAHERLRQPRLRPAQPPRARAGDRRCRSSTPREILSIEPLLERRPRQLSGGQQQRVALGRCIVRNPKVFLFDEPLSNLDAQLRAQMRLEIKELRQRVPTTSIFVTHDQVEAMTLGDRIVVMKDGLVQQVGTPLELYRRPANRFVASFIGSPAMNFFEMKVATDGSTFRLSADGVDLALPQARFPAVGRCVDGTATVGVRPQHLRLGAAANGNQVSPSAVS